MCHFTFEHCYTHFKVVISVSKTNLIFVNLWYTNWLSCFLFIALESCAWVKFGLQAFLFPSRTQTHDSAFPRQVLCHWAMSPGPSPEYFGIANRKLSHNHDYCLASAVNKFLSCKFTQAGVSCSLIWPLSCTVFYPVE